MTLHQRIRTDIEARILSGDYPPGYRLPPEEALAREYRCSRMTANKALGALATAGLIERRRRAGSFVARPRVQSVVLDIPDIQADITSRGARYGYELLAREARLTVCDNGEEPTFGFEGPLLALDGLHLAGDRPFALEHRLVSLRAVPEAAGVDFAETPPGTWLLAHVTWTEAEHRIMAENAGRATASLLGVEASTACLVLERRTWRGGERITYVRQTFPGSCYDLVARFAPAHA